MFTCPSCNGALKFHIPSQKLKCEHCGSSFSVEEYGLDNNAEETDFFGASIYTCSNCGAELISPDESIVSFCSYCGSEQVLESRMIRQKKPQRIIPFRVPKTKVKEAFAAKAGSVYCVPKEYQDPSFLEKFRGIYIPYWTYDVKFNDSIPMKGVKSYRRGDFVYEEDYDVDLGLNGVFGGIPYDASSAFDDSLADEIAPFHLKKMKEFKPAYLAGFYADSADVDVTAYEDAVIERAGNQAIDLASKSCAKKDSIDLKFPLKQEEQNALLGTEIIGHQATLFPVWFLTWRKKDRVAYAVVNGETGRISADIPVDMKRYLLYTGLTAAVLFLLLNFFISTTAQTALMIASALSVIAALTFSIQIRKLHDREMHIFDRGYFLSRRDTEITMEKAEKIRRKRQWGFSDLPDIVQNILICLLVFGLAPSTVFFFIVICDESPAKTAAIGTMILLAPAAYAFVSSLIYLRHIHEKGTALQALASFAASLLAAGLMFMKPVEDYWYYIGCVACLAAVLITCIGLLQRYNLYATRDIPAFFQRKGGDDSAKE